MVEEEMEKGGGRGGIVGGEVGGGDNGRDGEKGRIGEVSGGV